MPVLSAIIPKLYETPCDCILIIHFSSFDSALRKTSKKATPQTRELNGIAFHEAHDSRRKVRDETVHEMSSRFRIAREGSTAGPFSHE